MTRRVMTLVASPCIALVLAAGHFASGQQAPTPSSPAATAPPSAQAQPTNRPLTPEERVEVEARNAANNPTEQIPSVPESNTLPPAEPVVVQTDPVVTDPVDQPPPQGDDSPNPHAPILATRRLSYQAVLTDNLGNALPGPTVNLAFRIYSTVPALVEGPINVLNVPINNGVVSTLFDVSASSFDGADRLLGVSVNGGAELTPRIPLTAVPYALRVDRVASEELDDTINLGRAAAPFAAGLLNINNGVIAQESIELSGSAHRISTYGSDGLEQIRLWGPTFGEIQLYDNTDNNMTVLMSATSNSGGSLSLRGATGLEIALLNNTATGGSLSLQSETSQETVLLRNDSLGGGRLYTRDEAGLNTALLGSSSSAGGFLYLYQSNGSTLGMDVDGDASGAGGGANLNMRQANGITGVNLDADATNANGGGVITVSQADASTGVIIDGDFTNANGGGAVNVNDNASATRVRLDGESTGTGGEISVFDDDGTETVEILGAESTTTGGQILLRGADGISEIELDGEFGAAGDSGRIITPVLQITGGADLSEEFDIAGDFEPGMVVCIDEHNPGKLIKSTSAYDAKVAGVVAGAGGVKPGLIMAQKNKDEVDGKNSVALTGRVYCWVDASFGEIKPGDMLTTSSTPGHAMKVSDHSKANGAVIGKAMQPLKSGKGLVLVLVNLQ